MGPAGGSQDIFVPVVDDDERILGMRGCDENDAHDVKNPMDSFSFTCLIFKCLGMLGKVWLVNQVDEVKVVAGVENSDAQIWTNM